MSGNNATTTSSTTTSETKVCSLLIHDTQFSENDLVLNSNLFRVINAGDIIEIAWTPSSEAPSAAPTQEQRALLRWKRLVASSNTRQCIYLRARDVRSLKGAMKISLAKTVAATLQLTARQDVSVRLIDAADYGQFSLDHVELMFNNQYIGRGEMWRLKLKLRDTCAFVGRRITSCGVRCDVTETLRNGEPVLSGLITDQTSFVFRSRLGMFFLCVQMSREMAHFDSRGQLYRENAVAFLGDLFERWRDAGVTHCVTIVLFSRTFFPELDAAGVAALPADVGASLLLDRASGRYHRDHYRVVAYEEYSVDSVELLRRVKKAMISYDALVRADDANVAASGVNSTSTEGNMLEALHLALVQFERHYLDRDLNRTGQLVMMVTPGDSCMHVNKALSTTAKLKVIEQGVGVDLICLGQHPLHAAPLFGPPSNGFWHMPHWIQPSFYSVLCLFVNQRLDN